jgi:hypothetical protein
MTKKLAAVLYGMVFFSSCGDLPETRPADWNARQRFTDKPYTGDLFTAWKTMLRHPLLRASRVMPRKALTSPNAGKAPAHSPPAALSV